MSHAKNMDGNLAALHAWEAEQDKRQVEQEQLDRATAEAMRRMLLKADGVEWVQEGFAEASDSAHRAIAESLAAALWVVDHQQDADQADETIGRIVRKIVLNYMHTEAFKRAEAMLDPED